MPHVVDTHRMLAEDWLTPEQAAEIARRSREIMVALAVNAVLCAGIATATFGFIFWLAEPVAVAVVGTLFLLAGVAVLVWGKSDYRILGNAAAVIGAGMLVGGFGVELVNSHERVAEPVMLATGALVLGVGLFTVLKGPRATVFAAGCVLLMGIAMHLTGLCMLAEEAADWWRVPIFLYAALLIGGAGVLLNVRLVTALATVPLAGILAIGEDTLGVLSFVFPPEATLTIILMSATTALAVRWARTLPLELAGHALTVATMTAIFANLAFFSATWVGDGVGQIFLERPVWDDLKTDEENSGLFRIHERGLVFIPADVFIVVWGVVLAGTAFWAARQTRRGIFNAAMIFGGVHLVGQVLERRIDEPFVWALLGLALIPFAWGMWKVNRIMSARIPPAGRAGV